MSRMKHYPARWEQVVPSYVRFWCSGLHCRGRSGRLDCNAAARADPARDSLGSLLFTVNIEHSSQIRIGLLSCAPGVPPSRGVKQEATVGTKAAIFAVGIAGGSA